MRDDHGRTALFLSAEKGDRAVVELLLSRGASVDTVDDDGKTPLFVATER